MKLHSLVIAMLVVGSLGIAMQAQVIQPAAAEGPSFEETLAFIREKVAVHGGFSYENAARISAGSVKSIDVTSNTVSINKIESLADIRRGKVSHWDTKFSFSILEISNIILEGRPSDNAIAINLICKNKSECIQFDQKLGEGGYTNFRQTDYKSFKSSSADFEMKDETQANKLLQAFKHLFALRGWQEKKDLF